ncbi:potassium channel family protein [Deinococcus sp. YIM 77859]|uniref:potassium channel family protein n=1 Tax=Deinococcus sp. YIM 77859 TaxID=1540221 RepID=UPI000553A951|nr:potassium channel family protein [Deinococcus sp. YIM 77859]
MTLPPDPERLRRERMELLRHLDRLTDLPMTLLGFVWLALLIVDLTRGLSPGLQLLSNVIWGLFVLDFLLSFTVAPSKAAYLRANWLTALSLLLPAVRVLRVLRPLRSLRLLRATRSLNLVRLVTSLNRGFRAAGRTVRRHGVGYVALLTLLVALAGAAGMLAFEDLPEARESGLDGYVSWLWWTGMMLTTMGSDYFPKTAEGRALTWLLALYGFAVFGYITASVASLFVGRDQKTSEGEDEGAALRRELAALREEVAALRAAVLRRPEQEEH